MTRLSALILAGAAFSVASANTVLLSENFDGDYRASFPLMIDGDHNPPYANVNPMFMDSNGVAQPWWPLKDASTSSDRFMTSHSLYQNDGTSRDFLVSKAITIPSTGFNLDFDAQSIRFFGGNRLSSDLHLFILEELPTEATLPTADKAAKVYTQVPAGKDPDMAEGDFTHYQFNLDPWVGKTIYIAFANLNEKKDFLAIDNVVVQRLDMVELSANAPEYIMPGNVPLEVNLHSTATSYIGRWTLTATAGEFSETFIGESLAPGQEFSKTFNFPIKGDESISWSVVFKTEGMDDVPAYGNTTGLLFTPERRVLFEESTGAWCGNCPMGIYNIEQMEKDPQLSGKVIPVAVHIYDLGRSEPMVCENYAAPLGFDIAPYVALNRNSSFAFNPNYDCVYNPEDSHSVANAVLREQQRLSLAQVEITSSEITDDRKSVTFTAEVTPAVTLDGKIYKLGCALTEDNVQIEMEGLPIPHLNLIAPWIQHNYIAGQDFDGRVGGWCDLPSVVMSMPFQHVARAIDGFWGIAGSLPDAPLKGGEKITFTHTIAIPDTYREQTSRADGNTYMTAPAVNPDNLNIVVFMMDTRDCGIMNAAEAPANGREHERKDTAWLLDRYGAVETVETTFSGEAEYFTIEGIRVANPEKGRIYIVRRGAKAEKVIF